jgi:hypothetical protein
LADFSNWMKYSHSNLDLEIVILISNQINFVVTQLTLRN